MEIACDQKSGAYNDKEFVVNAIVVIKIVKYFFLLFSVQEVFVTDL